MSYPVPVEVMPYPRAAAYWSIRGRLPWDETWGATAPLTNGTGWAARLWASGPVSAVTVTLTEATAQGLNRLPHDRVLPVVRRIVQAADLRPDLGAVVPEWSPAPAVGWHFHALVSAQDADRLAGLPDHLGHAHVAPVGNLRAYRRALAYAQKRVRADLPLPARAAHAEYILDILAAEGRRRLPPMTLLFGLD